jgi:hypothetical protein
VSRGLGRRERQILARLDKQPALFLADLLPDGYRRAQYISLYRAAHTLLQKRFERSASARPPGVLALDLISLRPGGAGHY